MKRLILSTLTLGLLVGCSSSTAISTPEATSTPEVASVPEGLHILAPSGAPSYTLLPLEKDGNQDITIVDGSDALQAAFVNPDSEYEVIVAPTNLGAKLISSGKSEYQLFSILTTGNLYIVGEEGALETNGELALFGENAVPGLVFNHLFTDVSMNETWYSSVTEAQAALLAGNANAALLAEPAATATIAKAKENGKELTKLADLQDMWSSDGYPMASLFVRKDVLEENAESYKALVQELIDYADGVKDGTNNVQEDLDSLEDPTKFGATPSAMVAKTYEAMGINPMFAEDHEDSISDFLSIFSVEISDGVVYHFN